jgi:hypothetical protein
MCVCVCACMGQVAVPSGMQWMAREERAVRGTALLMCILYTQASEESYIVCVCKYIYERRRVLYIHIDVCMYVCI